MRAPGVALARGTDRLGEIVLNVVSIQLDAQTSRARCAFYNGHGAAKLEKAVLVYLGQYSDPKKARELLDASEGKEIRRRGRELTQVERRLAEVEAGFAKNLELLKRDVLSEEESRKANEARRDERVRLTGRQTELSDWPAQQHQRQEAAGSLPTRACSCLMDFQARDVRRAKALLQTILSAAHVYRDGRIELECGGVRVEGIRLVKGGLAAGASDLCVPSITHRTAGTEPTWPARKCPG